MVEVVNDLTPLRLLFSFAPKIRPICQIRSNSPLLREISGLGGKDSRVKTKTPSSGEDGVVSERDGGADGARTRDLQRDRLAL